MPFCPICMVLYLQLAAYRLFVGMQSSLFLKNFLAIFLCFDIFLVVSSEYFRFHIFRSVCVCVSFFAKSVPLQSMMMIL